MSIENKIKSYINSIVKASPILSPGDTGGFLGGPPAESAPSFSVSPAVAPPPPTSPWQSDPSYVPGRYSDPNAPYNCGNRPTGRHRVDVIGEFPPGTPQSTIDYYSTGFGGGPVIGTREARGSDKCPSCQSSSHPVCECLDAYAQYDYYSYNYVGPGGFGDCIIPPTKQLPSHCPSMEVNGVRSAGSISNYALNSNGSLGTWVGCYIDLMSYAFLNFSMSPGAPNNILGPTYLLGGQETTTLDDWNRFWQDMTTTTTTGVPAATRCAGDPESVRLAKMMFDARCYLTEQATTGACCSPAGDFGGFSCTQVSSAAQCNGQFYGGQTCEQIGGDNCGAAKDNPINQNLLITDLSKGPVSKTNINELVAAAIRKLKQ